MYNHSIRNDFLYTSGLTYNHSYTQNNGILKIIYRHIKKYIYHLYFTTTTDGRFTVGNYIRIRITISCILNPHIEITNIELLIFIERIFI